MTMKEQDKAEFYRGFYGENKDVERLMDDLDVLLVKVDEDTAAKIIQVAYRLARR